MKISVCVTVKNEEKTIEQLLISLINQSKKPDEIIIVDSCSKDKTIKIVKSFIKKYKYIRLIVKETSRAAGRNLAIEEAKNEIISMIDAGCIAEQEWLKKITDPFKKKSRLISAGLYKIIAKNNLQKAMGYFLGPVNEAPRVYTRGIPSGLSLRVEDFSHLLRLPVGRQVGEQNPSRRRQSLWRRSTEAESDSAKGENSSNKIYFPSTRSISFSKTTWKKLGKFNENLTDTAEDTYFNYKINKMKIPIIKSSNAIVYWQIPDNINDFSNLIYKYATGDALSTIWFWGTKKKFSHNVKILFKILRYILFLIIPFYIFKSYSAGLLLIFTVYSFWAFWKVGKHYGILSGLWGIIIQYITDIYGIKGFINGLIELYKNKLKIFLEIVFEMLLLVLIIRSCLYLYRTIKEYTQNIPQYYPDIDYCGNKNNFYTDEEEKYYFYKYYGEKCENN